MLVRIVGPSYNPPPCLVQSARDMSTIQGPPPGLGFQGSSQVLPSPFVVSKIILTGSIRFPLF